MQGKERTACCGLYCGDCIPADPSLYDTVKRLKQILHDCQFEEYAKYKSRSNRAFESFGGFEEILDAILTLRCDRTCPNGGGRPDCPIRLCARQTGLEGCWQCTGFETCALLEPLSPCHGDTHRHNLRMVRQYGIANWSHKRGRQYLWQKPKESPID